VTLQHTPASAGPEPNPSPLPSNPFACTPAVLENRRHQPWWAPSPNNRFQQMLLVFPLLISGVSLAALYCLAIVATRQLSGK